MLPGILFYKLKRDAIFKRRRLWMICWMETPWSRLWHRSNNRSPISYCLFILFCYSIAYNYAKMQLPWIFSEVFPDSKNQYFENTKWKYLHFTIMLQVIKKRYKENLIIFIFNFLKRILKFITFGNNLLNFPHKQFVGLVWCTFCCCCYFLWQFSCTLLKDNDVSHALI